MTAGASFASPEVEATFAAYPPALRERLLDLRGLILETAPGPLTESLKWGQPAYRPVDPRAGTTVRIDALKGSSDGYAVYFHCKTSLVSTFRGLYGDTFRFEGDRAILLRLDEAPPRAALAQCIALALTYRGRG